MDGIEKTAREIVALRGVGQDDRDTFRFLRLEKTHERAVRRVIARIEAEEREAARPTIHFEAPPPDEEVTSRVPYKLAERQREAERRAGEQR